MTIPDEAVQAAYSAYVTFIEDGGSVPVIDAVREALTAAAPFLQGVKVKAGRAVCYVSKDGEAISDILDMPLDFIYDALKAKRDDETSPSPRAQALEEAAKFIDKRVSDYVQEHGVTDSETGTVEFPGWGDEYVSELEELAEGIRALSSQPVADQLPQDVINLVIAAREAWDTWQLPEEEFKRLDTALEAFASRVPYENEPEALPASPVASSTRPTGGSNHGDA